MLAYIHKHGAATFAKECFYRLSDYNYERYFGVDTSGDLSCEELGLSNDESHNYTPLSYRHLIRVLDKLPVDVRRSTFLDIGCGKGRAVIVASSYGYRKVIGIDISDVITAATKNIASMKHRLTNDVDLVQCDARAFSIPPDVNVIYLFNPFRGMLLEDVARNINASYSSAPRKIYVIVFNNKHFEGCNATHGWLTKVSHSRVHPNISCGLYETSQ